MMDRKTYDNFMDYFTAQSYEKQDEIEEDLWHDAIGGRGHNYSLMLWVHVIRRMIDTGNDPHDHVWKGRQAVLASMADDAEAHRRREKSR